MLELMLETSSAAFDQGAQRMAKVASKREEHRPMSANAPASIRPLKFPDAIADKTSTSRLWAALVIQRQRSRGSAWPGGRAASASARYHSAHAVGSLSAR